MQDLWSSGLLALLACTSGTVSLGVCCHVIHMHGYVQEKRLFAKYSCFACILKKHKKKLQSPWTLDPVFWGEPFLQPSSCAGSSFLEWTPPAFFLYWVQISGLNPSSTPLPTSSLPKNFSVMSLVMVLQEWGWITDIWLVLCVRNELVLSERVNHHHPRKTCIRDFANKLLQQLGPVAVLNTVGCLVCR